MIPPSYSEPRTLRAGDTATWRRNLPEYQPLDGWVLSYRILFPTAAAISISCTVDGTDFVASIPAATSAAWTTGAATLVGRVAFGADAQTVYSSQLDVLPNLGTAATLDSRTSAEKALADAEAALAGYLGSSGHIATWTLGDKTMTFRSSADIIQLINFYRREVVRERQAGGLMSGRILVRNI